MSVDLDRLIELLDSRDDVTLTEFVRALVRSGQLILAGKQEDATPELVPELWWDVVALDAIKHIPKFTDIETEDYSWKNGPNVIVRTPGLSHICPISEMLRIYDGHDVIVTVDGQEYLHNPSCEDNGAFEWTSWGEHMQFPRDIEKGSRILIRAARIEMVEKRP